MEIFKRAIKEVQANPDAYRQYLKGYTPLQDDIALKVPMAHFKVCEDLGAKDIESIEKFFGLFTKYGVVDGKINVNNLLYCKTSEGI